MARDVGNDPPDDRADALDCFDALRLASRAEELERAAGRLRVLADLADQIRTPAAGVATAIIAREAVAAEHAAATGRALFERSTRAAARAVDAASETGRLRALLDGLERDTAELLRLATEQPRHALVAARWGVGLALTAGEPPAPALWALSSALLEFEGVVGCGDVDVEVRDRASLLAWVAGTLAHVEAQPPAFAVFSVVGRDHRYVQVAVCGDGRPRIESVGDDYLDDGDPLDAAAHGALAQLGFHPPVDGGSPNWWQDLGRPAVTEMAAVVVDTLLLVHGTAAGTAVRTTVDGFGDVVPGGADVDSPAGGAHRSASTSPGWLLPTDLTVGGVAEALVHRLEEVADVVELELLETTITQGPPDRPPLARIASRGTCVMVEVQDDLADEPARLADLGWSCDDRTSMWSRRWPADALSDACWHLVVALVAVAGVRWDRPLATSTRLRE